MDYYIKLIAEREGKTPEEIIQAIQEAIDAAWSSNDPEHHQAQKNLIGSPTAPNPEEFIAAVVREVQNKQ